MICKYCDQRIPNDSEYCPFCGLKIDFDNSHNEGDAQGEKSLLFKIKHHLTNSLSKISAAFKQETPVATQITHIADYVTPQKEIIPLGIRLKHAYKSANGLYPHEILMLTYAPSFKTSNNSFQGFWIYEYSVTNPQTILDSLYSRGFICLADVRSSLKKLVVADLKELLSKVGQKTSGKKDDLIERVLEVYRTEDLESLFPDRYYALTELGEAELKQNEYVIYLHRHHYMSVWDMNIKLNINNPNCLGYRDMLWGEFNKRSLDFAKEHRFGAYRNTRLDMHDFLLDEKKYKTALFHLCEVVSYDLSGLGNNFVPSSSHYYSKEGIYKSRIVNLFLSEDKKEVTLPPGIIRYFKNLYRELAMSDSEFTNFVYEQFARIRIYERIFTADECANVILSEIGLEERKIKGSYSVAKKRVRNILGCN